MLHLFNSCYAYPEVLFDPTCSYVVLGENYKAIGAGVTNSFYHSNTVTHEAIGRYRTLEEFVKSNIFEQSINNREKFIIYCDDTEFVKLYTAFLKTQVSNINPGFYLQTCRLEYRRLKTRSKLIQFDSIKIRLDELADKFLTMADMPSVDRLPLSAEWIKNNSGIEWKLAVGKTEYIEDIINRYVYSFMDEAKANFLSRKDPANSWIENPKNRQYGTVESFKDLYMEIRKEVALFTDKLILDFYESKDYSAVLKDPKVLMLLTSNKNMADKVNIWLLRWCMTMPKESLTNLGILA
jgi:hypothetical protein